MKFAFSSSIFQSLDPAGCGEKARQLGYDGIELATAGTDAPVVPSGTTIAAVVAPGGSEEAMRRAIELARSLVCPTVVLPAPAVPRKTTRAAVMAEFAERLRRLADHAVQQGITLAIQNAGGFVTAGDLWRLLEADVPQQVVACWDSMAGIAAGESPSVSVPVLGSRIRHVRLSTLPADSPLPLLLRKLKGIGYGGWVSVSATTGDEPEKLLAESLQRMRQWIAPPVAEKKAPPAHAKPPVKAAPAAAAG